VIKPRYQVSETGLELIMGFEGYRANAAQLPDGRWTIGHGHTKTARAGAHVSRDDAKILLLYDLTEINLALQELVFTPLNQNQVDALGSFSFNIGLPSFQDSIVLKHINEGDLLRAACAIDLWRRAELQGDDIVVDALVRRRAAEKALFLTPADGWTPAPSAVVRPKLDWNVAGVVPLTRPLQVRAPLDGEFATAEVIGATLNAESLSDIAPETIEQEDIRAEPEPTAAPLVLAEAASSTVAVIRSEAPSSEPEAFPFPNKDAAGPVTGLDLVDDQGVAPFPHASGSIAPETAPSASIEPVIMAAPTEPAPIEAKDREDEADLIPESFRPVRVSPDLFLEAALATTPSPEPAAPSAQATTLEAKPQPVRIAPAYAGPEALTPEMLERPILFPTLEERLEAGASLRTPASARLAGFQMTEAEDDRGGVALFIALGLFGLVVFTGAVFWVITRAPGPSAGPWLSGGAVALFGVGCVSAAVYCLVHRFLGRD
jgi:lysozyme